MGSAVLAIGNAGGRINITFFIWTIFKSSGINQKKTLKLVQPFRSSLATYTGTEDLYVYRLVCVCFVLYLLIYVAVNLCLLVVFDVGYLLLT